MHSILETRIQRVGRQVPRSGFTIIELMVSITIIGLLVAMLLPAVQSARETARRTTCMNHLKQYGIAITGFETTHREFPAGFGQSDLSPTAQMIEAHTAFRGGGVRRVTISDSSRAFPRFLAL